MDFDEEILPPGVSGTDGGITAVPTLVYYQKTYARVMDNNDQKATTLFKQYESTERVRRLQQELMWVAAGSVYEQVLEQVLGKKRRSRHKTYMEWGKMMLLWVAQAKR